MMHGKLEVLDGGLQTTVQDGGRPGYLAKGIPPAGAQDHYAFRMASLLVGNQVPPAPLTLGDTGDAGLECLMLGPKLRFSEDVTVAITGAECEPKIDDEPAATWESVRVPAGAIVDVGRAKRGARIYLAIATGIDVSAHLGSRSTYVRGAMGGHEGRALRRGDSLPLGARRDGLVARGRRVPERLRPSLDSPFSARVVMGPQDDLFEPEGLEAFLTAEWKLSPQSDRMGFRLEGPPCALRPRPEYLVRDAGAGPADIVDDVIPLGGIQIAGGVEPIVMGVEVPSSGGYAKIATLISSDLGTIGQMRPGESVRFSQVDLAEAVRIGQAQTASISVSALETNVARDGA